MKKPEDGLGRTTFVNSDLVPAKTATICFRRFELALENIENKQPVPFTRSWASSTNRTTLLLSDFLIMV